MGTYQREEKLYRGLVIPPPIDMHMRVLTKGEALGIELWSPPLIDMHMYGYLPKRRDIV